MDNEIRLREIARRLARCASSDKAVTGPIGYLIGAVYSLQEASRLCYLKGEVEDEAYREELQQVASALATGREPGLVVGARVFDSGKRDLSGIWLAGFFFNSALHRIAAGAERLGVHPTKGDVDEPKVIARVRRDVNKLKHLMADKPSQGARGLLTGREVGSIGSAIEALESLVVVAERKRLIDASA